MFYREDRIDTKKYKKISEKKKRKAWNSEECTGCEKPKENLFTQKKINVSGRTFRLLQKGEKMCKRCLNSREKTIRKLVEEYGG